MGEGLEYLTEEDIRAIISAAEEVNETHALLLKVLASTGARVSEIVGLSRYDSRDKRDHFELALTPAKINPKDNMIRLVCLKRKKYGGEWRYVKVSPSLIAELLDYVKRNRIGSGERIFPYSRRWVLELVKRYAEKAGVTISPPEERKHGRTPHPHLFRHSYAINLARQMRRPEELAILQRRLGHKTLNSTGIYLTRLPDSLPAPDF
jgi:integrase